MPVMPRVGATATAVCCGTDSVCAERKLSRVLYVLGVLQGAQSGKEAGRAAAVVLLCSLTPLQPPALVTARVLTAEPD
jgi:hypothetical protein